MIQLPSRASFTTRELADRIREAGSDQAIVQIIDTNERAWEYEITMVETDLSRKTSEAGVDDVLAVQKQGIEEKEEAMEERQTIQEGYVTVFGDEG